MKNRIIAMAITLLFTSQAFGESSFQITAGFGQANAEIATGEYDYKYANIGVNYGISDFYVSLNAMIPMTEGENVFWDYDYTYKRQQYSANIGYRITERIAVFIGGNFVDTEMSYYDFHTDNTNTRNAEETGLHIGVAGTLLATDAGMLTAKAAFSQAEIEIAWDDDSGNGADGSGNGYVYGIGWIGFITENWSYALNLDGYSYTYDDGYDSESTLLAVKASLGYMF